MKIQLITDKVTANKVNVGKEFSLECHTIDEPRSFDDYKINIIDLQNENLWQNNKYNNESIDKINDLISLSSILLNAKTAKTIIIFPQNTDMYYLDHYNGNYSNKMKLKDMLPVLMTCIMPNLLTEEIEDYTLSFERCRNKLNGNEYDSDFHFSQIPDKRIITTSECSEKTTTIQFADSIFITTINFLPNGIYDFLKEIKLIDTKEVCPAWLQEYSFFDDDDQKKKISDNMAIIDERNKENSIIQEKINENLNYKSILIETGENLVKVIFEMLEKMLNPDPSDFVDKMKEDFLIKTGDIIFVGEIKGGAGNITKAFVSQLSTHVIEYIEEHESENTENIKSLLIVNTFRGKELNNREPVNQDVVKLAETLKILAMTAETFLKLFEKFLKEEITTDEIISVFTDNTGLLTTDHF